MNSYERIQIMREVAPKIRSGEVEVPPIIPTGIFSLDKILNGGLPLEKLCVIAARTAHGKSATCVRLAVNMAMAGKSVHVFWLEDDEGEFDRRAIAALSNQPLPAVIAAYRSGRIDEFIGKISDQRLEAWRRVETHPMERPTVSQIAETIHTFKRNSVFILDHLGELDYGSGPKWEIMGDGLRYIRAAARLTRVLGICLTQLNRDWDRRKSQSDNPDQVRPVLSDIENSGQIEQIARVCIIAEKRMIRDGEEDRETGEYLYHVWKPTVAVAHCRWDRRTATPDNEAPVVFAAQGELDADNL